MVVNGEHPVAASRHFPLLESQDLFLRFKELELDRDSILKFVNRYGWIGETGGVGVATRHWVPAVGISRWHDEIQDMIVAYHLWECVKAGDQRRLRNYLTWHSTEFDVRLQIGIQKRKIISKDHPMIVGSSSLRGPRPWTIHRSWLID